MIEPTDNDIGRAVRLATIPDTTGVLVDAKGCGRCEKPCCKVRYGKRVIPTDPSRLMWADDSLL
jgi:hypothetical protein